ncbi:M23 family metallopeptidase [Streptomyces kronopolitis]|uniref:M23 family metallopeptidase n=1 Tax=Streptomyces kronopolitis TaxID=1612435 RepID=UPI0020BE7C8A|nr:M23 family metallopeptidase [Streptomyces kronopolitis]MCL6297447.1 peptidoglycan DD-metalloendopeptidase family protein [Streptomyces kronopolitis]
MNDRHPSGAPLPTGSPSDASYAHYPAYDSYGHQSPAGTAEYGDGDPLFGSLPGSYDTGMYDTGSHGTGMYDTGAYTADAHGMSAYGTGTFHAGAYAGQAAYDTGAYPTMQWETGAYETGGYPVVDPQAAAAGYDPYTHTAHEQPAQHTTGYPSSAYEAAGYETAAYETAGYETAGYPAATYGTGGYEATAYEATSYGYGGFDTGSFATGGYDLGGHDTAGHSAAGHDANGHDAGGHDAGYDTGSWPAAGFQAPETFESTGGFDALSRQATAVQETADHEATAVWSTTDQGLIAGIPAQSGPPEAEAAHWDTAHQDTAIWDAAGDAASVADAMTQAMPLTPAYATPAPDAPTGRRAARAEAEKAGRGRGRRRPAKRSALLTIAVPSVATLGVCAVAAASVAHFGEDDKTEATARSAPDATAVKPSAANNKLDTQLAGLSASADDFRDRASRTQERIDLKERQALDRKRKAEAAARKEAMRPKFVLPVTQHGLSATFGQAGVNWMSVHTGIDFPVSYGTPVMSATDGTIRTQWNSAYGNMAIVTAPDGTETWYCHLSSTKVRSGEVKAGDRIAYSGNSGNSTGPHLHFEVRPGGGAAVDPQPWLRDHGLNPN